MHAACSLKDRNQIQMAGGVQDGDDSSHPNDCKRPLSARCGIKGCRCSEGAANEVVPSSHPRTSLVPCLKCAAVSHSGSQ